jgi:lipopolysaccharide/colanic/teichoic acid biosynthesis glycosyltransferase
MGAMHGAQVAVKRILDVLLSAGFYLAFSPVFLAAAFLVKITSPGPVFFVQDRVGVNKRRFPLYKFRTMIQGAEKKQAQLEALNEVSGPVFKIKDDPRITPIGKILRKTSIDELPQLYNVLKGDMSLGGPASPAVKRL